MRVYVRERELFLIKNCVSERDRQARQPATTKTERDRNSQAGRQIDREDLRGSGDVHAFKNRVFSLLWSR